MRAILEGQRPPTKFAETHMHSNGSDGRMRPAQIVDIAVAHGQLATLAITDHEIIRPSVEARNYSERAGYDLEVVVGAEFSTKDGHLIGLYLNDDVVTGKPVEWTIAQIHKQNGLVIAPHPMYKWTRSLSLDKILSVLSNPDPDIRFDGFELFSAGVGDNPFTKANENALAFYLEVQGEMPEVAWKLGAAIASTDGHFYTVGRGITGYEEELREDIEQRRTSAWSLDLQEQARILDIAANMWGSMVLEPTRRIQRYAIRRYQQGMQTT